MKLSQIPKRRWLGKAVRFTNDYKSAYLIREDQHGCGIITKVMEHGVRITWLDSGESEDFYSGGLWLELTEEI